MFSLAYFSAFVFGSLKTESKGGEVTKMEHILLPTVIIAVVEFMKRLKESDWYGAGIILAAGIIGALVGQSHLEGLDLVTGIVSGLSAAGIVKTAQAIGGDK